MASSNSSPPSIEISTIDGLLAVLKITPSQGPVIADVVPYTTHTLYAERELSGLKFPFTLYTARIQTPIIPNPNSHHETANQYYHSTTDSHSRGMETKVDSLDDDSDTCKLEFSGMLIASINGGPVGQPHTFRPSMRNWPTIAIEFGTWLCRPVLREKARWWMKASNYEVKVVLIFLVDESREGVAIEKWTISQLPNRHGAFASFPFPSQHIILNRIERVSDVSRNGNTNSQFGAWNGPLRLKFEDLFLHEPTQGSEGGDVIISSGELQRLALATWRSMRI
ncbi:hypothetical protein V8C42DRAFT_345113 [Trichoderma barbatum]